MEITWRVTSGQGGGKKGETIQGIRSINRQGEVKNSIGNGEAKECIDMTHGHELRQGMWVGRGVQDRGE